VKILMKTCSCMLGCLVVLDLASGVFAQPKTFKNSIGMEFVLIPSGEFLMGGDKNWEDANDDETPRHKVTISKAFYLGKYEVTQAQCVAVMGSNPSPGRGWRTNPVTMVSWEVVQEFIRRLNQKEGTNAYRLPTGAEWEYAARAGAETAYCFGDDADQLGQYAWYNSNSGFRPHPVGQLNPNTWGLYDMHGNVEEWCQDWWDFYPQDPIQDPQGPTSGFARVLRGGSWTDDTIKCRSASRNSWPPDKHFATIGFRLVRTP
jgi:formylglycine-generating enzyme required for sulfatase activity